jgi:hypothetical protein
VAQDSQCGDWQDLTNGVIQDKEGHKRSHVEDRFVLLNAVFLVANSVMCMCSFLLHQSHLLWSSIGESGLVLTGGWRTSFVYGTSLNCRQCKKLGTDSSKYKLVCSRV